MPMPRRRRRAWKDLLLATTIAVAVAYLASRVNRAPPPPPPAAPYFSVLDEVIPEVDLDTRTVRTAIDSLSKRTRARIVIDPGVDVPDANPDTATQPPQTFRDVRLGALLSRILDQ